MASCIQRRISSTSYKMHILKGLIINSSLNYQNSRLLNTVARKLVYGEYGDPSKVVKIEEETLNGPGNGEVLVKMLAASVNPADINTIQGVYAVKPPLPSVPGNEGVGRIEAVGSGVTDLSEGDWVLPRLNAWGTWRTHAVCSSNELMKIPRDIGKIHASTLAVNPCTAYRMLHDFEKLSPGDVVIQNGGNSAVGQAVIQLCKHFQYKSVNIVRDRSTFSDLKSFLSSLGADVVITEEELRSTDIFKRLPKPKLALNCVGGKNALDMLRYVAFRGTMVTYGGMSRQPVTVPTSTLIFKDIKIRGFWMTQWSNDNKDSQERERMLNFLCELIKKEEFEPPAHKLLPFSEFKEALENAMNIKGFTGCKYVLNIDT